MFICAKSSRKEKTCQERKVIAMDNLTLLKLFKIEMNGYLIFYSYLSANREKL